ncbi:hypothetical protein DJ75_09800 [Halorubrum sp. Eb13]|nr:hypothetical protein DJ75_09800 [Halorubrum sp. Eb13]
MVLWGRSMSRLTALTKRASASPVRTFMFVLIAVSAAVAAMLYAVFGSELPGTAAIVYAWTPMMSAGLTVWIVDESIRDWLGQLRNLRVGIHWYLAGIGIMLLGTEFETIVTLVSGGDVSVPAAPPLAYLITFGVTLLLAGAIEELAWRGFLQPRLQRRFSAISASVFIGIIWGLWHVPMILGGAGNFTVFWEYMLNITMMSVILGWLYNSTNGALPAVMIAHASHNMPPVGDPTGGAPGVFETLSGDAIFYLCCAVAITLYAGSQTLTRDRSLPDIPGQLTGQPGQESHSAD